MLHREHEKISGLLRKIPLGVCNENCGIWKSACHCSAQFLCVVNNNGGFLYRKIVNCGENFFDVDYVEGVKIVAFKVNFTANRLISDVDCNLGGLTVQLLFTLHSSFNLNNKAFEMAV